MDGGGRSFDVKWMKWIGKRVGVKQRPEQRSNTMVKNTKGSKLNSPRECLVEEAYKFVFPRFLPAASPVRFTSEYSPL